MSGNRPGWLVPVLLTATFAAGCDVPLDPFEENTIGPFSVFGYLDVTADTQWVRVMPIRQNLLADSAAIDAVVTLEHLGNGRVVTLRDSLFSFRRFSNPGLSEVGYAHNFWTTEPIEPGAAYRLTAVRSDGSRTTARVETPELEVTLRYFDIVDLPGFRLGRQLFVQAEHLLYNDLMYTVWHNDLDRGVDPVRVRQVASMTDPGRWRFVLPGIGFGQALDMPPFDDMLRREAQIAVAESDWPFEPGLSVTEVAIPGTVPSTVEDGVGFLVGVATRTIPLPFCMPLEPRADGSQDCTTVFDQSSASIVGRVTRDPCSPPRQLVTLRLTERFAGGGAVVWQWSADWDGTYRFEGLEPGSNLFLEFADSPVETMRIPPLGPGERYVAPHVTIPRSC